MRIKVTRQKMMSEIMKTARAAWSLRGRIAWLAGYSWGDCLRYAWQCCNYRYEIEKKQKPVVIMQVINKADPYDLSFMYGNGQYNGD